MLFDPDKHLTRISARAMAPRTLEQKQRDVFESHRHRVFSVSFYMTGNEMEAEEILQGTFVRAFGRAEEPDHAIVDAALMEQLSEHLILEDEHLPIPRTEDLPESRNILRPDLEEAIRCLPTLERLIFLLTDVEGYPAQRVAELLNMSASAVLRASITARMRLRAELASLRSDGECAA